MAETLQLNRPWLVAVWPGMGHVALNAGVYLLSKLEMGLIAEFEANHLFDIDQVEVKEGIIQIPRRPRNRLFLWKDPNKKHDLIVFLGEAQPPIGKYAFCRQLLEHVATLKVECVVTFAAMATQMHPQDRSRVFGAATNEQSLGELKRLELDVLSDGNIGGLNGVLLGAAAEAGLRGVCLLGEMPHVFAQLPYPRASLGILEAFTSLADLEIDLAQLAEQAKQTDTQLGQLLQRLQKDYSSPEEAEEGEIAEFAPPSPEKGLAPDDEKRIEAMFEQAAKDRSKAFELKQELDRLRVFADYEDRFLDLFKKPS